MIRIASILLFLCSSQIIFGQQVLTDNINGQWCVYDKGQRLMLDPLIHDLGNFDDLGLTYFMRHEKFGIINSTGEAVIKEQYKSIQQLGGGYYLLLNDQKQQILANWKSGKIHLREILSNDQIQENWYVVELDSFQRLINVRGKKEWELSEKDEIIQSDFKHVYCSIDSVSRLFDAVGNEIYFGEKSPFFTKDYLLRHSSNDVKIIYRNHQIDLPRDAKRIRIREDDVLFSQEGKSTILSTKDGSVISVFPYENVSFYNNNTLTFRQNRKVGLAKKTGEILVPANYASISIVGDLYFVRKTTGAGILDKNGNQLIPCKYNYVVAYRDFFEVHNSIDFAGLFSRKTGKNILTCDYAKIKLNDTIIRAFSQDMLRIIKLDTNHRVVNDIVMSNVTSLVKTNASSDTDFDERLYPLGWFHEGVPKFDSLGFSDGEVIRWGLKGANDTMLIAPRYKQPKYIEHADFSLIVNPRKEVNVPGIGRRTTDQYQVRSHRTGRLLVPEGVISLDTLDLLSRSYVRFVSEKGRGVLLDDNSILRVDYIDGEDNRYLRYCTSLKTEMIPADKREYDAVRFYDFNMNNDPSLWQAVNIKRREYNYIRYDDAKWNYLDTNGKTVFSESFEFAQPYSYETALVKKDGKWGVVRADSFAIPAIYAHVKRSPISDTLFVVKKSGIGRRYLDSNGRLLSNGITRFYSNKGCFAQVAINGEKKLIAPNYEIISGDTRFQRVLNDNTFYSKKKKLYTVYNSEGIQLGEVLLKPEAVWFENYVLAKSRGKFGVLSCDNDTILTFKYKNISELGGYIFAENGSENLLLDQDFKPVKKLKAKDVLVDSITGNYAIISFDKAQLFSATGKKLAKLKGTKFKHFHNNWLIEFGKTLRVLTVEKELNFDFQPKEFVLMGENGYLIIDSRKIGHHFNLDWEELRYDGPLTRAKYVGEGLAFSHSRNGSRLFGGTTDISFENGYKSKGEFANGFLLLERENQHEFVDIEGINQFKRKFKDAGPFLGEYAVVKESGGWTIIDEKGHFQILPGFDEIKSLSPTIFSTKAQPMYGLFDAHGNELIPAEFQQLNFLRNDVIQGRKGGGIFYFDRNGTPISLN